MSRETTSNGKKPALMRALTDPKPRISYADSELNFRQYNEMYEKWLEARHRDSIRPYTEQHSRRFDLFATETARRMTYETERGILIITRRLQEILREPGELERYTNLWREMGRRVRENFVLEVFEDECRNFDSLGLPWPRDDCPELTLDWASGVDGEGVANWIRIWQQLGTEEPKPQEGELPYFNLRNDKWDRVNGVFDIENAAIPAKQSIRAFVHDGIADRNFELRSFIEQVLLKLDGKRHSEAPRSSHNNYLHQSGEAELIQQFRKDGVIAQVDIDSVNRGDLKFCEYCGAGAHQKKVNLQCSRCKSKVDRIVRYCSEECQRQHWNSGHSAICGKLLSESQQIPSFAPSPSKPSIKTSSDPSMTAELTTSFDKLSIKPSASLKHGWRQALLGNERGVWILCDTDPEDFDPRATTVMRVKMIDGSEYFAEKLLYAMRSISLSYLAAQEEEDERLLNLMLVVIRLFTPGRDRAAMDALQLNYRWLAKLSGREGEGLNDLCAEASEFRIDAAIEIIYAEEQYSVLVDKLEYDKSNFIIKQKAWYLQQALENYQTSYWYSPDIREHNPLACAATRPPRGFYDPPEEAFPVSFCYDYLSDNRIRDVTPQQRDRRRLLLNTLRERAFHALEDPLKNLESLGIVLLSVGNVAQLSEDTGVDLGTLESARQIVARKYHQDKGEEWNIIREALRTAQGSWEGEESTLAEAAGRNAKKNKKKNDKKKEKKKAAAAEESRKQAQE